MFVGLGMAGVVKNDADEETAEVEFGAAAVDDAVVDSNIGGVGVSDAELVFKETEGGGVSVAAGIITYCCFFILKNTQ
jgi:hypothetical protein